jgi:hypothetical protein
MAYTVNVTETGKYRVFIFVATVSDTGELHIEFDGENKTGSITVPNTGGYQNWQAFETTVNLKKGTQIMKLVLDSADSGLNLDRIEFKEY